MLSKHFVTSSLVVVIISFFVFKCIYFSSDLKVGVLPDELTHLRVIEAYYNSDNFTIDPVTLGPSNAAGISQDMFVYHLISAKSAKLLNIDLSAIWYFRAINIFVGILSLVVFYLLSKIIFRRPSMRIISLVLFSNILMFTASSTSISYDPLSNLISLLIIYLTFYVLEYHQLNRLFVIGGLIILGTFVKASVLPFLPIVGLVLLLDQSRRDNIKKYLLTSSSYTRNKWLVVCLFLCGLFASTVVVKNFNNYGKPIRIRCAHIFDASTCKEKDGLVKWYSSLRKENIEKPRVSMINYFDNWEDQMIKYTFGIAAHQFMVLTNSEYYAIKIIVILGFLGWLICYKNKYFKEISLLFILYSLILLIYVNYRSYLSHGDLNAGIHGRYLFPVLSMAIIMISRGLDQISLKLKAPLLLPFIASSFFIFLDFPSYLQDPNLANFNNGIKHSIVEDDISVGNLSGTKIHIDLIEDKNVHHLDSVFHVTGDFKVQGWAFDERLETLGQSLNFSINQGALKRANYNIERRDVADAYDNPKIALCGYAIFIPFKALNQDTNTVNIYLQYDETTMYKDFRTIYLTHD